MGCSSGWIQHRYSCIKLITSPTQNFQNAQSSCQSDGGKLLQFDFMEELSEFVTAFGSKSFQTLYFCTVQKALLTVQIPETNQI